MLYTDHQREWQELFIREIHGENIERDLEPGYKEEYGAWKEKEKENLPKLSAEDRVEHFTEYLQKSLLQKKQEVIEKLDVDEAKEKELLALAQKDQLLLVSKDNGVHFDEVLTKQEAEKVDSLKYRILSSSFISTSTELETVVEEQTLLHVVSNLKGVGYDVDSAELKDHHVVLQVTLPKAQAEAEHLRYEVAVDQAPLLPLEYQYLSGTEIKRIPETILAEEVGTPEQEPTLILPTETEVRELTLTGAGSKGETGDETDVKAQVALASFAGIYGAQSAFQASKEARISEVAEAYEREQFTFKKDAPLLNVMASKRKRQNQQVDEQKRAEDDRVRRTSRDKKYEKDRLRALERQAKEEERRTQSAHRGKNRFRMGAILGSAAGTGLMGGIGFLGIWSGQ